MHVVEQELLKATAYKAQRKFTNRQDYLGSVLNAVLKLSNDDFDSLSDEAAAWANAAVASKNAKDPELPDFDEVVEGNNASDVDNVDGTEATSGAVPDTGVLEVEAAPVVDEQDVVPKKAKKPPSDTYQQVEEDVALDKWGSMEGTKTSIALSMFEKGATTKEVKDAIGGTYYNILKKMSKLGHKLEKEGALIKLTHKGHKD